ncbi:hypothetical protein [Winogradskyella bathintestinalis]|uniref:MORN repeat variant n=1 Tax=Winogradskyella bathintestinalis TaxID=3035208 RepID=A0ABT7ZUI6_9FLAO|nr:hypothetical protein [Winogradskyella bathintestinalis]MDN3492687.1 hypothetical protein [Winogradskyella bathintestinalis]
MKNIWSLLIFPLLMVVQDLSAQETLNFDDLYIHNDLIYKVSNDSLFSGICEKRRKNGHLVMEESFKNGIILSAKYYYNGKRKIMSDSVIYNFTKPYEYKALYRFNMKTQNISEKNTYDTNGKLILVENFKNNKLTYSCEYNGKQKHGKEFCYTKEGLLLEYEYMDGKKVKD